MVKCKKHPKYKAKFKPRAKCTLCEMIFREKIVSIIMQRCLEIPNFETKKYMIPDDLLQYIPKIKNAVELSYRVAKSNISNTSFNEFWVNKD